MTSHDTLIAPNSEQNSLILHAHHHCAYGKCSYCPNFQKGRIERFNINEFKDFLATEARHYVAEEVDAVFLAEGNTLGLPARKVVEIIESIQKTFPRVSSISAYGSARSLARVAIEDLELYKKSGLTRVHMGFESADDDVLNVLNKGVDSAQIVNAFENILAADLELHVYVLVGAGGKEFSSQHVANTVACLNRFKVDSVECHTLVMLPGTPLESEVSAGRFQPLSPHETIQEVSDLVSAIEIPTHFTCTDKSNYCQVEGSLPDDQKRLLTELQYSLETTEELLQQKDLYNISIPQG